MATGTTNTTSQKSAALGKTERFIERQLGKTRLQVRLIDLASGLMTLMTGVLLYLLTWAVVDHWLWPLGFGGRWLAFALLLGGSAYYLLVVVVPLLFRPINPIYAARAIEQAEPTLKNSLINFLFFRTERTAVADQVYSALQDRAASDLHRVAIDTVVDRSQAIMVGYVLAGVLALAAAYKILSPKDPFQSVARVATPWAEIARPSRVQIQDVQPGDAEVFQGESVTVSAAVKGHADQVLLSYSTTDGEVDNLPIAMRPTGIGDRFECSLPAAGSGLKQDATYQITAGDATSATFRLRVSPAPNITVAQVEYDYPAYVKRAPDSHPGQSPDPHGVHRVRSGYRAGNREWQSAADGRKGAGGESDVRPQVKTESQRARTRRLPVAIYNGLGTRKHPAHVASNRGHSGFGSRSRNPDAHEGRDGAAAGRCAAHRSPRPGPRLWTHVAAAAECARELGTVQRSFVRGPNGRTWPNNAKVRLPATRPGLGGRRSCDLLGDGGRQPARTR